MRIQPVAFVCAILAAAPAAAQLTPDQARARADRAPVVILVPDGTWAGRLVDIDGDRVTIELPGGSQKLLPLQGILHIDARKRDSVVNGAIAGGLIGGVWCLIVCGQGLDSRSDLGSVALFNALVGAGIGVSIDAAHVSKVSIYERPPVAPARQPRRLLFTVRF